MFRVLETANQYFNYGDALLEGIIFTDWAKQKFNIWLLSLWSLIIRLHIISLVCFFITYGPYLDFIMHTLISIFFTIYRHWFYIMVEKAKDYNMVLVNYLLENYSATNYRIWKRCFLLSICIYGIIICLFMSIDSLSIIVYITEYIIAFIVVDVIENRSLDNIIKNYKDKPKHVVYAKFTIDDNYSNNRPLIENYSEDIINDDGKSIINDATKIIHDKNFGSISFVMIDNYKKN